jgi:Outer membrane protein beta-barrel domain
MKQLSILLLAMVPFLAFCQQDSTVNKTNSTEKAGKTTSTEQKPHRSLGIGIKAGLNFTNVTGTSSISNSSETGFLVGLFLNPESHSILGSTTELVYSHQAYNYSTGQTTGTTYLNYLMLAQLMDINITHFVQIQIGTQFGYLLNAKTDSNTMTIPGVPYANTILDYYNRFIFGFSGGVEVRPILGLLVGARYNLSLTDLYKIPSSTSANEPPPSFIPSSNDINFKNNVIQVYVGWRF